MRLILLSLAAFCITGCATQPGSVHIEAVARHGMAAKAKVMSAIKKAEKLKKDVPEVNKAAVADLEQDVREANAQLDFAIPELKKAHEENVTLRTERDVAIGEKRQAEETRDKWRRKANKLMAIAAVAAGAVSWSILRILPLPWRLAGVAAVALVSYLLLYSFL